MILPKVLIVGQSFDKKTGGGITLSNLFEGWDKDKIAVACTPHLIVNSDNYVCNEYYQLGEKEHRWLFPFNYLQRKFASGPVHFEPSQATTIQKTKKQKFRSKIVDNLFFPFLQITGLIHCFSKTVLSEEFCTWVNDFKPDIIYAQGQDRQRILFTSLLYSYLQKPLVFHMMDDWPLTISDKGIFRKFWQKKIDLELRSVFDKASLLMSISDYMAEAYRVRYNKNFMTFHNPIEIAFWKKKQRTNYEINKNAKILYAGRISLGIEKSLETVAKAIEIVNSKLKSSIKFNLQTNEIPKWINKYECVERAGFVSYGELPGIFSGADFLIIPYDFSRKSINYIRYSMPTKAPEYMISGTPIIIFAPEITAIVKYAKKKEWAWVITENDPSILAHEIENLFRNKKDRQRIAENAINLAIKNHDAVNVRDSFRNSISSLL